MRSSPILYYAFSMGATNRNWVFFLKIAIKISRNTNYCNITTTILIEFQLTAPLKNTLQKTNVNLLEIRYFWSGTQLQIEGGDYHMNRDVGRFCETANSCSTCELTVWYFSRGCQQIQQKLFTYDNCSWSWALQKYTAVRWIVFVHTDIRAYWIDTTICSTSIQNAVMCAYVQRNIRNEYRIDLI